MRLTKNPLKNPKLISKPAEKKEESKINNYVQQKPIIQSDKNAGDKAKRNIVDHSKKQLQPTSSPEKKISDKRKSLIFKGRPSEGGKSNGGAEEKKFTDLLKDINKKVVNDQPQKLSELKNQYLEKIKVEKKDIKDYYNIHKMMVELDVNE